MKGLVVGVVLVLFAGWLSYRMVDEPGAGQASCGAPVTAEMAVLLAAETTGGALHSLASEAPSSEVVARETLGAMGVVGAWAGAFAAAVRGDERPAAASQYEARAVSVHQASLTACSPCPGATVQPAVAPGDAEAVTRAAAAAAGFTGPDLDVAVAVAAAESGHRDVDNAGTNRNGTTDYGRWQINTVHADLLDDEDWRDPYANARMARTVWERAGRSWTPWVTYNNGAYREHLTDSPATLVAPAAACAPAGGGIVTAGTSPTPAGALTRPVAGRVSSEYGYRIHPVYGERRLHGGIDIAAPCGTPVTASAPGVVTQASDQGSYGNIVVVDHGAGLATGYAHLERFAVTSGPVQQGQTIGYVGTTGTSTGCHLHFEVREGADRVNPRGHVTFGSATV